MAKRRQKGEGGLYQRRSDGMWIGVVDLGWYGGRRQRRTVSAKSYKSARAKLAELKRAIDEHGDTPERTITLEKWLRYWYAHVATRRLKPSTLASYQSKIETMLIPELGRHRLDRLRPEHLRAAYARLEEGRSSTTVLQAHSILRKALTDAVREQRVHRNVATLLDAPQKAPSTRRPLSTSEARTVLMYAARSDDPLASGWAAALLSGARQGERLGLTWDAVDLDYRHPETGEPSPRMEISWALQRIRYRHGCGDPTGDAWPCGRKRGGSCPARVLDVRRDFEYRQLDGGLCLIRPKSRAGWRIVPVVPWLESALRQRLEVSVGHPNPHNLVWARPDGRPIDPRDDSAKWDADLRAAGVSDVTVHEARNTTASLLHEAGVDGHTVQQIMGHSSVTTTRGYQHVDVQMARVGMSRMTDLLQLEP